MELKHSFSLKVDDQFTRFALVVAGIVAVVAIVCGCLTLTLSTIAGQGDGDRRPGVPLSVRPGHGLDQAQQSRVEGARRALDDGPGLT